MPPAKALPPPLRGQSSLDAFFGVAKAKDGSANQGKKTRGKQTKLDAFVASSSTTTSSAKKKTESKTVAVRSQKTKSIIASSPPKKSPPKSTTTKANVSQPKVNAATVVNKSKEKKSVVLIEDRDDDKKEEHIDDEAVVVEEEFEFVVEEEEEESTNVSIKKETIQRKHVLAPSNNKNSVNDTNKRQRTNKKTFIDDDDDATVDMGVRPQEKDNDDDDDNNNNNNKNAKVDTGVHLEEENYDDDDDDDDQNNKKVDSDVKEIETKERGKTSVVDEDDNTTTGSLNSSDDELPDDMSVGSTNSEDQKPSKPKKEKATAKAKKAPSSGSSKATKKSDTVAKAMKTDDQLLEASASVGSWEMGKELPYLVLCEVFEKIEETPGRLEIQRMMTDLMRQVILKYPPDLHSLLYLASNSVAPAYECVELGIGDAILNKAIGEAFGTNPALIKKKYANEGDLGTVAKLSKSMQRTLGFGVKLKPLLAKEVLQAFREIARMTGSKSQKAKVDRIKKLLVRAQPIEAKFSIRGLQGKLRIGLAQTTVLISLAHALALTTPKGVDDGDDNDNDAPNDDDASTENHGPANVSLTYDKSAPPEKRLEAAVAIIKQAYSEVPSYDAILDAALRAPLQKMHIHCTLTPGIPVSPMLAKPTKSIQEILKRLNGLTFTCEYKYDGERAQVHMLPDGTTKVFSRNLLDTSEKYPEVPLFVKEAAVDVTSFVLDAEVVAFNNKTGTLVPFQVLSTRKKTEESAETAKVQVIVQAFDLMYLNGRSLLKATFKERRDLLRKHFRAVDGKFQFAKSMDHKENGDTACIEEFLDLAVKGQCEGLMVKTLDENAVYEPSRRSLNWLKLKKDYLEGLGDSVDLVPLGAYHGRGKRTGVYGAYLLACYDADSEEFQSVCKLGTGFSDEDLKTLSETLNNHRIPQKSGMYKVSDQLECDVWFDATVVWEVKAADLSKSSVHSCAIGMTGETGRGIGLRFPCFVRIRDDKKPDQATTSEQILEMYYNQGNVTAQGGGDEENEDFYDQADDEGI